MIQRVLKNNFICPKASNNSKKNPSLSLKRLTSDTISFKSYELPLIPDELLIESIADQIYDFFEAALDESEEYFANNNKKNKPDFSKIKQVLSPLDTVTTGLVLNHLVRLLEDQNGELLEKIDLAKMLVSVSKVSSEENTQDNSVLSMDLLKEETILHTALNLYKSAWKEVETSSQLSDEIVNLENYIQIRSYLGTLEENNINKMKEYNRILRRIIGLYDKNLKKFTEY